MITYELSLTNLAREDIEKSRKFSPNLGNYFHDSIVSDLDALTFYAGIHQKVFGFYRMLTKHFPYGIYYDIEGSLVIVHALLHTRQDPSAIVDRLRDKITKA